MGWYRRGRRPAPPPDEEESRLLERLRRGDLAAFDALARRYERPAFAVAFRILRHREDAEDLVQEAFLTAIDRIDTFRPGSACRPWFFRIVVNRAFNVLASRRVRRAEPLDHEVEAPAPTPEVDAERAQLRDRAAAAIAGLSERQRLVVELYELEGFSSPEIAAMLGVAESTVRWTLREARARLRAVLSPLRRDVVDA